MERLGRLLVTRGPAPQGRQAGGGDGGEPSGDLWAAVLSTGPLQAANPNTAAPQPLFCCSAPVTALYAWGY